MQHSRAIFSPKQAGKAEISYLQEKAIREQKIFRFDVSVSVTFLVHIVQAIHHLMKIGSGNFLREFSCLNDVVEELASSRVF